MSGLPGMPPGGGGDHSGSLAGEKRQGPGAHEGGGDHARWERGGSRGGENEDRRAGRDAE